MEDRIQKRLEAKEEQVLAEIARISQEEGIVLPNMTVIDSKFSIGIALLQSRVETEPYLRHGFLYSGNNGHHAVAFYKIPTGATIQDEIDPMFTVIGTDLTSCLHNAAMELTQTESGHPTNWEIYTVDKEDLGKIKKYISHSACTNKKPHMTFSIHRTPLTDLIEQNTPETKSESQESELDLLRKNILKRYENAPVNPSEQPL